MGPTNEDSKCWICDVDENGVLTFTDELWEFLDWKEGDVIEFVEQDDESFILRKVETDSNDQDP